MKYIFALLLFSLTFSTNAQTIDIVQDQVEYEKKQYPSYSIYIEPDSKATKKELKDFFKDRYDVKLKGIGFLSNKDVLYAEEIRINSISDKKMDFFAKVIEEGNRTKISFFGAYGYSIPVSPDENYQDYSNLRSTMIAFIDDYLPGYYTEQVQDVNDVVEDYREEKADLKDDIADNKDDIQKKLEEIEKLRAENEELTEELSKTSSKLMDSEEELQKVKSELDKINSQLKLLSDNPK